MKPNNCVFSKPPTSPCIS